MLQALSRRRATQKELKEIRRMLDEYRGRPKMNALGWALLHFLWQGAALAAGPGRRAADREPCVARDAVWPEHAHARSHDHRRASHYALSIAGASQPASVAESSMNVVEAASSAALERAFTVQTTSTVESVLPWLVVTWASGAGLLLLRLLGGWLTARRSIRAGVTCGRDFSMLGRGSDSPGQWTFWSHRWRLSLTCSAGSSRR